MDLSDEFAYLELRKTLKEDLNLADIDQKAELVRAGAHIQTRWGVIVHYTRRFPLGMLGAIIVGAFVIMAIFADVIAPHDPVQTNAPYSLMAPNSHFGLGGDMMGRDLLSRLIHGARISLAVGLTSTFVGGIIGVALGLACGFLMGWFDLIV